MDFSPDGRTAVASCEFDGQLLLIDMVNEKVLESIDVGGMPQDVKLSPDATVYYVADMKLNGVHVDRRHHLPADRFIKTGAGAHGLYPSRDATKLYVSNRGEGSVSVIDFATGQVVAKWVFNGGAGSPDMGGVSADGKVLWLTGRYDGEVYAISTETGKLIVPPIKVGSGSPRRLRLAPTGPLLHGPHRDLPLNEGRRRRADPIEVSARPGAQSACSPLNNVRISDRRVSLEGYRAGGGRVIRCLTKPCPADPGGGRPSRRRGLRRRRQRGPLGPTRAARSPIAW